MTRDEARTLFAVLAEETLERIRQDRQRAQPERVRAMLAYIERHLLTRGLTLTRICQACQIADRSISTVFRRSVGLTPARYIESCRMELAERLLRETQIKIIWIAEYLGFASLEVFTNAFARFKQDRPKAYRNRCVAKALEEGLAPSWEAQGILLLRRAMAGALSNSEASILIKTLIDLYPAADTQPHYPSSFEIDPAPDWLLSL